VRGVWNRWAPHGTSVMALYALTVCLVLLVSGWVEPWWLVSALAVELVSVAGYTVWKVQQRQRRRGEYRGEPQTDPDR
jgi:hypothetical protein